MSSKAIYTFITLLVILLCGYQCDGKLDIKEEIDMRTCEVIKSNGYPCEIHHVTTKDSYILELHRIPHGSTSDVTASGNVTFLQHGLLDSSYTWVMNSPDKSLAYILADKGYDVWLGNSRGNTYSYKHLYLTKDDVKYWDFSFPEMAKYDLPASIDYILKQTGKQQVDYIGHSQGTMIGFAGFSSIPSLARKIKLFVALAPVVTLSHMKGLLKYLNYGSRIGKIILRWLGVKDFMPPSWVIKKMSKLVCEEQATHSLCSSLIFLIAGYDASNLIVDRIPIYTSHCPAGTSVKDILHFSQNSDSGKFQMYDYGWNGNMHRYLQPYPPSYHTYMMDVPVALFSGQNDWLATPGDIGESLRRTGQLRNLIFDCTIQDWNHVDFVWGREANTVIYENVVRLLQGVVPEKYGKKKSGEQ